MFVGGDKLPGVVIAFVKKAEGTPAHLLVRTHQSIGNPAQASSQIVRVDLQYVRAISWRAESIEDVEPGSILLTDGKQVAYRGLRWSEDSVLALTNTKIEEFAFAEIAGLSLPTKDCWAAYYRELAVLSPSGADQLVRLETATGLMVTTSDSRFDAVAVWGSPHERQRVEDLITRLQQKRQDFVSKQQDEQKKLTQKLAEYQQKRVQQLQKLRNDVRAKRNRVKKLRQDEIDRKTEGLMQRRTTAIEEQAVNLSQNYRQIIATNIQRHKDRVSDLDQQLLEAKQGGSGTGSQPQHWYHMVHPAWSLEPLWLNFNSIRTRWTFAPHEVPLSRLEPIRTTQTSVFGSSWGWQSNRNVRGSELQSAGQKFGWGFGVHATSELNFAIPSFAKSFRSQVGLDDVVGAGGCIRAEVHLKEGSESRRLFRSETIVGSQSVVQTGSLNLTGARAPQKELILTIDAAHEGRPEHADPQDIRDHANWLEPMLELDPKALQAVIRTLVEQ